VEGDYLVAIDPPIVKNHMGNRPVEAALTRDLARFQAGAHPANTGMPAFSGTPPGGARLRCLRPSSLGRGWREGLASPGIECHGGMGSG